MSSTKVARSGQLYTVNITINKLHVIHRKINVNKNLNLFLTTFFLTIFGDFLLSSVILLQSFWRLCCEWMVSHALFQSLVVVA